MIILDTNVLSETMRVTPDQRVAAWLIAQPRNSLWTTSVVEAELRFGVALLSDGRRKRSLQELLDAMLGDLEGRVLPFDSKAATAYAGIAAQRRQTGKPLALLDGLIAATARSLNATIATRNVADFTGCGVELVDPSSA